MPVLFGLKDLEKPKQRQSELHWTRPQQEERERKAGTPRPNPMPTGTLTSGRGVRSADAPLGRPVRARILVTVERGPLFSAEEDAGSRMEVRQTGDRPSNASGAFELMHRLLLLQWQPRLVRYCCSLRDPACRRPLQQQRSACAALFSMSFSCLVGSGRNDGCAPVGIH